MAIPANSAVIVPEVRGEEQPHRPGRREAIGRLCEMTDARAMAEMLIDLEEDRLVASRSRTRLRVSL